MKVEDTTRLFTREMATRHDNVTKADEVQKTCLLMNDTLLKGSKRVCEMTKGPPRLGGGIEMWNKWLPNERYVTCGQEGSRRTCAGCPRDQVTRIHCCSSG